MAGHPVGFAALELVGAFTPFDVAPGLLSPTSPTQLREELR